LTITSSRGGKIYRVDNIILGITLALGLIGMVVLFAITDTTPYFFLFRKQAVFFMVALVLLILALKIPTRIHYALAYYYMIFVGLLLVVVLFQGGGIRRWLRLGDFQIQPAEFAKLAWVFALARFLSERKNNVNSWKPILIATLVMFFLFFLVIAEPDLGTGIVFFAILIGMLYFAGVRFINLFILISPFLSLLTAFHWISWAVYFLFLLFVLYRNKSKPLLFWIVGGINFLFGIITPIVWNHLYDYQRARILTFIAPTRDPFGQGYQLLQSKIAIGSGGLLGKGFSKGTQVELEFLPARYTDFVFASLCEKFGFIGAVLVIVLYALLVSKLIEVATYARTAFSRLVVFGIATIIFFQTFVNIAMTVGLMPVTGIPLPFITPGGSSLLTLIFAIGVVLNIDARSGD